MHPTTHIAYSGTALPEDSDTETLYDSTDNGVPLQHLGIRRFAYEINHSHAGTVKGSFSPDGGTTWREFYSSESQSVVAGDMTGDDVLVEPYEHVRFQWVNGGTTQTTFEPNLSVSCDRSPMDDTGRSYTYKLFDGVSTGASQDTVRIDMGGIAGGSLQAAWAADGGGNEADGTLTLYLSNKDDPTPGTSADWWDSGESFSSNPDASGAGTGHLVFRGGFARWAYVGFARSGGSATATLDLWAHIREEGR